MLACRKVEHKENVDTLKTKVGERLATLVRDSDLDVWFEKKNYYVFVVERQNLCTQESEKSWLLELLTKIGQNLWLCVKYCFFSTY